MGEGRPPGEADSPDMRAYRRGFRQKSRRDDYALDLFQEIRESLGHDLERVSRALAALTRLYNPLADGPIVDLPSRARILGLLEQGRTGEALAVLEARYRLYAPPDDAERRGPTGPGA